MSRLPINIDHFEPVEPQQAAKVIALARAAYQGRRTSNDSDGDRHDALERMMERAPRSSPFMFSAIITPGDAARADHLRRVSSRSDLALSTVARRCRSIAKAISSKCGLSGSRTRPATETTCSIVHGTPAIRQAIMALLAIVIAATVSMKCRISSSVITGLRSTISLLLSRKTTTSNESGPAGKDGSP